MTDIDEIAARLEAANSLYPNTPEGLYAYFDAMDNMKDHAAEDLEALLSRCTALEALALELAGAGRSAECSLTEAIRDNKSWARDCDADAVVALRAALSSPLLAELRAKEEDEPADCTSCDGSGEISYPLMEDGSVDFISGRHVGFMGECQDCHGTGKQEAGR